MDKRKLARSSGGKSSKSNKENGMISVYNTFIELVLTQHIDSRVNYQLHDEEERKYISDSGMKIRKKIRQNKQLKPYAILTRGQKLIFINDNFMCWNIREIGNKASVSQLERYVKQYKLSFIVLIEPMIVFEKAQGI